MPVPTTQQIAAYLDTLDYGQLIQFWQSQKDARATADAWSSAAKQRVFDQTFGPGLKEGSATVEIGGGWKLAGTAKIDYKLAEIAQVNAALHAIKNETGEYPATLVRWKGELSLKDYRQLPEPLKIIIDRVITTKPVPPDLELKPPKADE